MGKRKRSRSPRRRSRSRSPNRKSRGSPDKKRDRSHKRRSRSPRRRSLSKSPEYTKERKQEKTDTTKAPGKDDDSHVEARTGDISLSVEETNSLRAKLGLAPLETNDAPAGEVQHSSGGTVLADGVVWTPAEDITGNKHTDKVKEKLAALKEKRALTQKYEKVKPLSAADDADDLLNWVTKSRLTEAEKKKAELDGKLLEGASKDFGLDDIVETKKKSSDKSKNYSARSLQGLKVEHSVDEFMEGESAILTLKDKAILDENEEDILLNPNKEQDRRYKQNILTKQKGVGYQAYGDDDFDEDGMPKMPVLLSKYDEVLEGEQKKAFRIGAFGEIDDEEAKYRQQVKEQLSKNMVSLSLPAFRVASEYRTAEEENAKFKKRKKVKKVKTALKADDLLPDDAVPEESNDHGSRNGPKMKKPEVDSDEELLLKNDAPPIKIEDDVPILPKVKKTEVIVKASAQKSDSARLVAERLKRMAALSSVKKEPEESKLVFDNTAEFCRSVSEAHRTDPDDKMSKKNLDAELEEFAMAASSDEEDNPSGGWDSMDTSQKNSEESKKPIVSTSHVLSEEPEVGAGVTGALLLAKQKGYLEKEGGTRTMGPVTQGKSEYVPSYAIEDKTAKQVEDKWSRKEERDRHSLREFKDKHYVPKFNLEYCDSNGRKLNEKEAFRELSHKFHGKGSCKMKLYKRAKKIEEEKKLESMSSDDTPLRTVTTMKEKQRSLGAAYLVLSGVGQNLASTSLDFKK